MSSPLCVPSRLRTQASTVVMCGCWNPAITVPSLPISSWVAGVVPWTTMQE